MIQAGTRAAIEAELARADMMRAETLALNALANGERDTLLFRLAAAARVRVEDYAEAHALLAAALAMAPDSADTLTDIAAIWRLAGNPAQAFRMLDEIIATWSDHAPALLQRGHAHAGDNQHRAANADYRRAAAIDPSLADAMAGVAETCLSLGQTADAADFAMRALALDPHQVVAQHSLAQLDIDRGHYDPAKERLDALLGRADLSGTERVQTLSLLGDALDGSGDVDAAFAAYRSANDAYRSLHAPRFGDERRGQTALIGHIRRGFLAADPVAWEGPSTDGAAQGAPHVFLLGYPRSGTTLVENVFASLPRVSVLEEKPTLVATEGPLLGAADGVNRVAIMGEESAEPFRQAYWSAVAAHGVNIGGEAFVDMDPLKGIYLPVIARLFPAARIVVMRRDPRDIVWSCYRRNFRITPAAYAFSNLESAARHYDALMGLMQDCLDRLPLASFVLRYDRLVADFEGETRRLCAFAGLAWSPAVNTFAQTAARRDVATASVRQVRRGLFDGTGQWRRYRDHLAPILPILQPWVERFGFPD